VNLADIRATTASLDGELLVYARYPATGGTFLIDSFTAVGNTLVADIPQTAVDAILARLLDAIVTQANL
jgi:hypothetical protein